MRRDERIYRSSFRGLRQCPACGTLVGNRAKGCTSKLCRLHIAKKPTKPKHSMDPVQLISYKESKLYSVQIKERDINQRSFVQITDTTLSADLDGSIVSRNAICYVDTCKYDSKDISISCKHVKSASECTRIAHEMKVSKDILYAMNISAELKNALWELQTKSENLVPALQRINRSSFAIECPTSLTFPAGRLHLTVTSDYDSEFSYTCACKKLRILLSPNNSVEIENDVCDHLIFLLTAVLSSQQLQEEFQNLMTALNSYWAKNDFCFTNDFLQTEDFASFSENILNSVVEYNPEDSLTAENNILHNDPSMTSDDIATAVASTVNRIGEVVTMSFPSEEFSDNQYTECLELADCQIELMDQFKLTNQIDLCNDEIQLCEDALLEGSTIPCSMNYNEGSDQIIGNTRRTDSHVHIETKDDKKGKKFQKPKISEIIQIEEQECISPPQMEFSSWLTYVIEEINDGIQFDLTKTEIKLRFNIKNEFFTFLSERFSIGEKKRIPNSTILIKKGKYKGLIQSTWIFTTVPALKRIFTNNDICIEFEKRFVEKSKGNFVPYQYDYSLEKFNTKKRRILPVMYSAFINLIRKESDQERRGFIIQWLPNAFPKSKFGILTIEYFIGFKENNKMLKILPKATV